MTLNMCSAATRKRDRTTEERIEKLAQASITLSQLAPELAGIASTLAAGARQQASQAEEIADCVEKMADGLTAAMQTLEHSSTNVSEIVAAIKRVADQTRILSINASIEAARAGNVGLAFGAVAHEVESLAGQTTQATARISGRVEQIRTDIRRALDAAGLDEKSNSGKAPTMGIRQLGGQMKEMSGIATNTALAARSVDQTSSRIRTLCEELLLEVGAFRLPAHEHAVNLFRQLLGMDEFATGRREDCEAVMRKAVAQMRIFELIYMTDARGRQTSSNIWADGREDALVCGADWSRRPWFASVLESGEVSVSDIYRSSATDSFCFTLSGPLFDMNGDFCGVLAADVNFADLLSL
jgi:hypothetical protein